MNDNRNELDAAARAELAALGDLSALKAPLSLFIEKERWYYDMHTRYFCLQGL